MTHQQHAFDYVELAFPDLESAKTFYGSAFGWTFTDYGAPGEPPAYVGINRPDGDGEMGGFNPAATPGRGGGVLVMLWTADVDASVAAVRAAGGEVVQGPYEFPGGRRFHLVDPAGNEIGVWG